MENNSIWNGQAKEDFHLFLYDKNTKMPIAIENIGITHPSPRYSIKRRDNNYFIMEYVVSGKGYLEIDGKKFTLEPGDVYCIEPGYDHKYYSDPSDPFEKIWINFFSDIFKEVFQAFSLHGIFVFKNSGCRQYFENILAVSETSIYSDEICYEVCSFLFLIVTMLAENIQTKKRIPDDVRKIKDILDGALYSSITIEEIADRLFISKMQLTRIFCKYYNQTPYNYLLNQKIQMAKKFLLNSSMSVKNISDKLAFNDPHYFSRIFKKKTGYSPQSYRNNHK